MLEAARLCQLQGQMESARRLFQQSHQLLTDSPTCTNNPQIQEQVKEQLLVLCANSYDQGWVSGSHLPPTSHCDRVKLWDATSLTLVKSWDVASLTLVKLWDVASLSLHEESRTESKDLEQPQTDSVGVHAAHIYDLYSYNLPRHVCYLHLSVCLWYWLIC